VFVPLLSESFLFSTACEDELTYAKDHGKDIVPLMVSSNEFDSVLRSPEEHVHRDPDIELRTPKFESILNRCNRIPATGEFEEDFDNYFDVVLQRIEISLQSKTEDRIDGHGSEGGTEIERSISFGTLPSLTYETIVSELSGESATTACRELQRRCRDEDGRSIGDLCDTVVRHGGIIALVTLIKTAIEETKTRQEGRATLVEAERCHKLESLANEEPSSQSVEAVAVATLRVLLEDRYREDACDEQEAKPESFLLPNAELNPRHNRRKNQSTFIC